jgi:hypothetical protein
MSSPLIIGGTGGSGTRVVTRIIRAGGRFMGARLNASDDAEDLVAFDWRWGPTYIASGASSSMIEDFEVALARHRAPIVETDFPWGWKHPHSYLMLPFLDRELPELRFVHVVRDGRDMAFSSNQNQLRHYGRAAIGASSGPEPVSSIRFWSWANLRAADYGEQRLGARYLRVRLEDLAHAPEANVKRLLAFSGAPPSASSDAVAEVQVAESLGRWRRLEPEAVEGVTRAGRSGLRRFDYLSRRQAVATVAAAVRRSSRP